nr:MAG TPA: hypothetical protein [Caudoviricetes sp.]
MPICAERKKIPKFLTLDNWYYLKLGYNHG